MTPESPTHVVYVGGIFSNENFQAVVHQEAQGGFIIGRVTGVLDDLVKYLRESPEVKYVVVDTVTQDCMLLNKQEGWKTSQWRASVQAYLEGLRESISGLMGMFNKIMVM